MKTMPCAVTSDLNRFMEEQDKQARYDDAVDKLSEELLEKMHVRVYLHGVGVVELRDEAGNILSDEYLEKAGNIEQWMRDAIRARAEKQIENQGE